MDFFLIFLCAVVGRVFSGLESEAAIVNEDSKFHEDVKEAFPGVSSYDVKLTTDPVRNLTAAKHPISASLLTPSTDPGSPVLKPSTLTPTPSKTKKVCYGMVLGSPAKHFQMLRELTHRNISANFLDNFRGVTKSIDRQGTNTADKTKKSLRRNYMIFSEYCTAVYNKLPLELRIAIATTDYYELALCWQAGHAHEKTALETIFGECNKRIENEREILKTLVQKAGPQGAELIADYAALGRNGDPWKSDNPNSLSFTRTPSALLRDYETWKKYEFETGGQAKLPEPERTGTEKIGRSKTNEVRAGKVQEVEKVRVHEAEKSTAHEADSGTGKRHRVRVRSIDNSKTLTESSSAMQFLLTRLPDVLKTKILVTDDEEQQLLEYLAKSQSVPSDVLAAYKRAHRDERQLLKRVLKEAESYGPRILQAYKQIRKVKPWNYIKLNEKFRVYFQQPSAALTEYEVLKRAESESLDSFLSEPNQAIAIREREREEADEVYRKARAKAEVRSGNQTDERAVEMGKNVRARKPETRRTEKTANREETEDDVDSTQNVQTSNGILISRDDVTSADMTHTKNSGNARPGVSRNFVGIAILLSVSINATLSILILVLYRKEMVDCFWSMKITKATSADEETEPLNPGKMAAATGSAYDILKTTPDAIMK